MKVFWTLAKLVIALVVLIPLSLIVLGTAVLALRLALLAFVAYLGFKLVARLFRGPAAKNEPKQIPRPESVDRHYEEALRELDRDLGEPVRR
jgi:hypothetical protein